jgi:hypothetical protein
MWDWRHNKSTARLCGVVAAAGCVCRCAAHTWGCPAAPPHMRACCGACLPTPSLPTHPWSTCVCAHLHTYTPTSLLSLPLRALHLEQRVALRTIGHLAQLASGMGFGYGNDCVWDFVVKSRHSTWNPTHFTTNPTTSPHPNRILARPPAPRRERARHAGASFVWRRGRHFGVISG